jgi:ABC-type transport system substrate-binding protein
MIDRAYFWGEVVPYVGVPMRHITPPGIFGAPPLDEVGIGFDPDYARDQLALGGYPNCEGLPPVEIATFTAERFMAFIVASAESVLGCDPDLFTVNVMDFGDLGGRTDPALPPEARPHLWFAAWSADYPDANNYVQDLLGCTAHNPFQRSCGPVDDLIYQAMRETDVLTRVALYREIEARFFGPDGAFPVIPVMLLASYELHQPWITLFNGVASTWDRIAIDQDMQADHRASP